MRWPRARAHLARLQCPTPGERCDERQSIVCGRGHAGRGRVAGLVGVWPASAQATKREPTPTTTLKSTEVASDHKVTFRIYAPKASEVSVSRRIRPGGKLTKDDHGRLVDHRRAADAGLLQLHLQRRRRPHRRPEERDGQAGSGQRDSMFLVPGDEADFEVDQGRAPRRNPRRLVSLRHARTRSAACTSTRPRLRGGSDKYPVFYLLARRWRRRRGLEHDRPRGLHPRQPDRRQEGACR